MCLLYLVVNIDRLEGGTGGGLSCWLGGRVMKVALAAVLCNWQAHAAWSGPSACAAQRQGSSSLMRVRCADVVPCEILNTPEVMRVYIGSFNDKPVNESAVGPIGKELFEKEQEDLLADLKDIPKKACDRRVNEFVKRARAAKIHAYIIGQLKKEMPAMMGKAKAQQRLIDNLQDEFAKVQREYHLPAGDFPDVEHFKQVLAGYSIDKFEKIKPKMVQAVDDMLAHDIPDLLKNFSNPYQ